MTVPDSAKTSTYRYITTNLMTGVVQGDWLPVEPQSFSAVINGGAGALVSSASTGTTTGQFAGSLNLVPDLVQNAANVAAITPRQSVLWVIQDGTPIWNGVIWNWQPSTILKGVPVPVQANTMDFLLSRRVIETDQVFNGADICTIARDLIRYAFSKPYPNSQVAGITYSSALAGISDTVTFAGSQNQTVADALGTLVTTYGLEYYFRPYMDASGNLLTSVDLAYPALGQPFPQSGLSYNFPGNLLDYQFIATGASSANRIIATAESSDGSGVPLTGQAIDFSDLDAGAPLLEISTSPTGVTFSFDAQLDAYAAGLIPVTTGALLTPILVLGNGQQPELAITQLGSWAQVALTSALHPAQPDGSPGYSATGRVVAWTCYPPTQQQAESAWIQMGNMPFIST